MAIPMRDVVGFATPQKIDTFGEKIHKKLVSDNALKQAAYEKSGKISGGKMGKPSLWVVLSMIGVPDELDPYLLGKFMRGNDVELRAINLLTGVPMSKLFKLSESDDGAELKIKATKGAILNGDFTLQKKGGYRGGTGYIDLTQHALNGDIYHEIKSVTKMAYDRVAATGRSAKLKQKDGSYKAGKPEPYYWHEQQLAYYCLGDGVDRAYLHYFNADDYRLCSFSINPLDYKEEIDKEIDDVTSAFLTKQLPVFQGFLDFHKVKQYWNYKEWNELSPTQMMDKLEREYPECYKKFMEMQI